MLVKTVTYEDLNGDTRTEKVYFNISRRELLQFSLENQSLESDIQRMIDADDNLGIFNAFEEIVLKAYGEKTEDGKRFVKSKELAEAFVQTPCYDELFVTLISSESEMADFISGLLPMKFIEESINESHDETQKEKLKELQGTLHQMGLQKA